MAIKTVPFDEIPPDEDDDRHGIGANGLQTAARKKLKALAARIDRLDAERDALGADIREIFAEAKGVGFDVKALKSAIKRRREDRETVEAFDGILAVYEDALRD